LPYVQSSSSLSAFITPKMRLLNTETLKLRQFGQELFPEYAILSHRYGDQEVSFQELEAGLEPKKMAIKRSRRSAPRQETEASDGAEWIRVA
jgi:hypothetical protein